jgi:hypothetical protein
MPSSREATEIRRAQFEIPGFTATAVGLLVDEALVLCEHQARRYGQTVLLEGIVQRLQDARTRVTNWVHNAQMLTDYDCARDAVRREREG